MQQDITETKYDFKELSPTYKEIKYHMPSVYAYKGISIVCLVDFPPEVKKCQ